MVDLSPALVTAVKRWLLRLLPCRDEATGEVETHGAVILDQKTSLDHKISSWSIPALYVAVAPPFLMVWR